MKRLISTTGLQKGFPTIAVKEIAAVRNCSKVNLHWTTSLAEALALPNKLSALHLKTPASPRLTSLKISAPLGSTVWRSVGSDEFNLDHVIVGVGFPSAMHFMMAVWLSLTVVSTGRCSKKGAEGDWPGSPLVPFTPFGPWGPAGPGSPGRPRSPLIPGCPGGPISPCFQGGPSGPGLPGEPGFPRIPGLPRLPVLPLGPKRHSFSSFAQIWFCRSRSSCFRSSFTWETVW